MKNLIKIVTVVIVAIAGINSALAQTTNKDYDAVKAASMEATVYQMIKDTNFVFEANPGMPERGGQQQLAHGYYLKLAKDSVTVFLPDFEKAVLKPNDATTTEGVIKFTGTDFKYMITRTKNGYRNVLITPRHKKIGTWSNVQKLILHISSYNSAILDVAINDGNYITHRGEIVAAEKK